MKLLLTGHRGFVGGWMMSAGGCVGLDDENGDLVDLLDYGSVQSAISRIKPDAVLHLAAQSAVPESFVDPAATFNTNLTGTQNLLTALKAADFSGRMLFVSTAEVYGESLGDQVPIYEQALLKPLNPYAVSKLAAEALCSFWHRVEGMDVVIARPFNHIGPGQSTRFAIADFAKAITEMRLGRREPVLKVGDLDVTRDFTDMRDVVKAYHALLSDAEPGGTYNVCTGVERHMQQAVATLAELAGVQLRIEVDATRFRKSGQRRACGSRDKLTKQTGWVPKIAWETSLQDILNDWEQKLA